MWLSLDSADKGEVCLDDLDADAVTCLLDFTRLLRIFFDDLDSSWFAVLDPEASGRCTMDEFERARKVLGYIRDAKQLQRFLDICNNGVITIDELEAVGTELRFFRLWRIWLQVLGLPRGSMEEAGSQGSLLNRAMCSLDMCTYVGRYILSSIGPSVRPSVTDVLHMSYRCMVVACVDGWLPVAAVRMHCM